MEEEGAPETVWIVLPSAPGGPTREGFQIVGSSPLISASLESHKKIKRNRASIESQRVRIVGKSEVLVSKIQPATADESSPGLSGSSGQVPHITRRGCSAIYTSNSHKPRVRGRLRPQHWGGSCESKQQILQTYGNIIRIQSKHCGVIAPEDPVIAVPDFQCSGLVLLADCRTRKHTTQANQVHVYPRDI